MKTLGSRNILIICVTVVLIALIVFVNYNADESARNTEGVKNTQMEVSQSAQCDQVADTFYQNFHSNMDSVMFYNELKVNPNTASGVSIGQGIILKVSPKFNDKGCLDFVMLERDYLQFFGHQMEMRYDPNKFDEEEVEIRDVIKNELSKVYGKATVKSSKGVWEYTYLDKKVKCIVSSQAIALDGKMGAGDILIDANTIKSPLGITKITDEERKWMGKTREFHGYTYTIYFYSQRYINERDKLDTEKKLERKRLQQIDDSIERTAGQRLR